jgi:hypothetical protein
MALIFSAAAATGGFAAGLALAGLAAAGYCAAKMQRTARDGGRD